MNIEEFKAQVSLHMERDWHVTWEDACGDNHPLATALDAGWTPQQFVEWFAEKYDLIRFDDAWPRLS